MIKQILKKIFNWLRRDDQRLEPLRLDVQQQDKPVDWDALQEICTYIIYAVGIVGFGVMIAMWITL